MQVLSVAVARKNFKAVIDSVLFNQASVVIHRKASESVVMISLDEFNAIKETQYLLSNPTNANCLLDSIRQMNGGQKIYKELIEE